MKFEISIENSFAKAIANPDFKVNLDALKFASNKIAEGTEIDFLKIINDSEISDRLLELLTIAPLDDYANFELYEGGEQAFNHSMQVNTIYAEDKDGIVALSPEKRSEILTDLDCYMSKFSGLQGNKITGIELGVSKTEYEMCKKMLDAGEFDITIANSIHIMRKLIDELSPEYVKNHMSVNDVKAIVSSLDKNINEDFDVSDLSYEVSKFVSATMFSTSKPQVLFSAMSIFANSVDYGVEEEAVNNNILFKLSNRASNEQPVITPEIIETYYNALERESKVVMFPVAMATPSDTPLKTIAERLDESFLTEEDRMYLTSRLKESNLTTEERNNINEKLKADNLTDEERRMFAEFDDDYDDEVQNGGKKKRRLQMR